VTPAAVTAVSSHVVPCLCHTSQLLASAAVVALHPVFSLMSLLVVAV